MGDGVLGCFLGLLFGLLCGGNGGFSGCVCVI